MGLPTPPEREREGGTRPPSQRGPVLCMPYVTRGPRLTVIDPGQHRALVPASKRQGPSTPRAARILSLPPDPPPLTFWRCRAPRGPGSPPPRCRGPWSPARPPPSRCPPRRREEAGAHRAPLPWRRRSAVVGGGDGLRRRPPMTKRALGVLLVRRRARQQEGRRQASPGCRDSWCLAHNNTMRTLLKGPPPSPPRRRVGNGKSRDGRGPFKVGTAGAGVGPLFIRPIEGLHATWHHPINTPQGVYLLSTRTSRARPTPAPESSQCPYRNP